jgi:NAD+ kinase
VLKVHFEDKDKKVESWASPGKIKKPKFGSLYALNQITIDRGSFNYLTNIECYINGHPLTVIQGDGVIIASPTGSTAYNMSAGGSIVYNYVHSLLLTPICPHSLSFRPLILPDNCCITLRASEKSRSDFYNVSLDGDHKFELHRGEKIDIEGSMCTLPFVTFNPEDPMAEWWKRLNDSLHWNARPLQKTFTK